MYTDASPVYSKDSKLFYQHGLISDLETTKVCFIGFLHT